MRWTLSFRIRYQRRRDLVVLVTLALVVTGYLGYLVLSRAAVSASAPWSSPQAVAVGARKYYITTSEYDGADADGIDGNGAGVCDSGYHFASLWEILDPTNLEYNGILGMTFADSGQGPAAGQPAWVRTGAVAFTGPSAGEANCNTWDSRNGGHYGSVSWLDDAWEMAHDVLAWEADTVPCNFQRRVWCVEDIAVPGTCGDTLTIACGQQVSDNNANYPSNYDGYSCGWNNLTGQEVIYSFELPPGGIYDVAAQITGFSEDLDIFLLGNCDLGQCIDPATYGEDTATASGLGPGLYYIAVDGYDYAASDYTLELSCSSVGLDNEVYLPLVIKE